MKNIKPLTIDDVEYLGHSLAKRLLEWDEKIPDFTTRFPNKLESCLATPFQTFSKKNLYPSLVKKASILFYLLIKNHPFQNGNKRIAVTSLFVFLNKNDKWIDVGPSKLYRFSVDVAKSNSEDKEAIVVLIENFINKHLVNAK